MRGSTTRASSSINALDAQAQGADIRVRTRVTGARREGGLWRATLHRAPIGAPSEVTARAHRQRRRALGQGRCSTASAPRRAKASVRHIKGSHIVVPRVHPEEHAYILQNADKRIVFVIPYHDDYSLIGTTDIPVDAYEQPAIRDEEIDYLLELANSYLAKPLAKSDIVWTYSGVRPLLR